MILTLLLLAALCDPATLWLDAEKTRASFVPEQAFASPVKYGLTKSTIAEISKEMDQAKETVEAINGSAESLGIKPSECIQAAIENLPEPTAAGIGQIVALNPGWNRERQQASTLVCIKVIEMTRGEAPSAILMDLPTGSIRVGRTTWCTESQPPLSLAVGQKVSFTGAPDPHNDGLLAGRISLK
jgi:hypothetical protein